jgi:hypothetical protein
MANRRTPRSAEDKKNTRLGCGIIFAAILFIGGCNALINDDDDKQSASGSSSSSEAVTDDTETIKVANYVGMQLQAAQDAAQEVGIYDLRSEDYTGRGRNQWADRNWTVCEQIPEAGTTMVTDATLIFNVVNHSLGESCDDDPAAGDLDDSYTDDEDSTTSGGTEDDKNSDKDSTTSSGGSSTGGDDYSDGGDADIGDGSSGGGFTDGGGGFTNGGGGKWF